MAGFTDARATWDGRYSNANGFLFGEAPNRWLAANAFRIAPGAKVLSIADGEGRNSVWLARQGFEVTEFDVSPVGVARAREFASSHGVEPDLRVADIARWDWQPQAFDAVAAIFFQFAPPALRSRIFEGIATALVPGGLLIVEGYGLRQLRYRTGGPGIAENLYTVQILAQAFAGWQILASRELDCEVREGAGHHGRSHLISMVLRKPHGAADTF